MSKLLISSVIAAAALAPIPAFAQAAPAPSIIVVDLQKASADCNACKTAFANLKSQLDGLQSYASSQNATIAAEQKSIQAKVDALAGKEPDATLNAQIDAWGRKREAAQNSVSTREAQFSRNRDYVNYQISQKLDPAITAVMTKRGANIALDASQVLRAVAAMDATADVIAQLNSTLTSVSTTAPAQSASAPRPATPTPAVAPKTTPKKK